MEPLILFEDVDFTYPSGQKALCGLNFELYPSQRVALLGLNGSGKSTLLLHTNGLLVPDKGCVKVAGVPTDSKDKSKIRQCVGMVFQNADDQLFMPTVREDVAFGPRNMKLSPKEVEIRVTQALEATGCSELASRAPFELSGGQKKMVSIATVLSMNPSVLVMDEPTSGLDYKAEQTFLSIISGLPQAILMSTHNIELARRVCDRAIVLDNGKIVFDGPVNELNYPPVNY